MKNEFILTIKKLLLAEITENAELKIEATKELASYTLSAEEQLELAVEVQKLEAQLEDKSGDEIIAEWKKEIREHSCKGE